MHVVGEDQHKPSHRRVHHLHDVARSVRLPGLWSPATGRSRIDFIVSPGQASFGTLRRVTQYIFIWLLKKFLLFELILLLACVYPGKVYEFHYHITVYMVLWTHPGVFFRVQCVVPLIKNELRCIFDPYERQKCT